MERYIIYKLDSNIDIKNNLKKNLVELFDFEFF